MKKASFANSKKMVSIGRGETKWYKKMMNRKRRAFAKKAMTAAEANSFDVKNTSSHDIS